LDGTNGWVTQVTYTALSYFGAVIGGMRFSEQFSNYQPNQTNNWPAYTPSNGMATLPDGRFMDQICVTGTGGVPQPTPPQIPLGATLVDSGTQTWSVGTSSTGPGVPVQTDTLQRWLDHGAHYQPVSPLR
jgi:hypothetical protein